MFGRIRFMIIKEFIQTFRDKRLRPIIFVTPIIQLLILGFAVTTDVKNISTAFYDLDKSYESRELMRRFESSGYFTVKYLPASDKELTNLLERAKILCAIQINKDFSKDIKRGKQTEIQIILDGTDSNSAIVAMGYANQIIIKFAKDLAGNKIKTSFKNLDMRIRAWYNPELKSKNFFVPGVTAVLIMLTCLLLTSMAVVREREIGTIEQLMVTPLKPIELILGKTIPFACVGFFDMFIVTFMAVVVFKIPVEGSIPLLTFCTGIYILSALGIGLFISTVTKSQQQALMSTFLFFAPAMILSGFLFPIENMPRIIQYGTYLNPLRYFLVIIRGIFLKGNGFEILHNQIVPLFVLGIAVIILSALRFKKRMA